MVRKRVVVGVTDGTGRGCDAIERELPGAGRGRVLTLHPNVSATVAVESGPVLC